MGRILAAITFLICLQASAAEVPRVAVMICFPDFKKACDEFKELLKRPECDIKEENIVVIEAGKDPKAITEELKKRGLDKLRHVPVWVASHGKEVKGELFLGAGKDEVSAEKVKEAIRKGTSDPSLLFSSCNSGAACRPGECVGATCGPKEIVQFHLTERLDDVARESIRLFCDKSAFNAAGFLSKDKLSNALYGKLGFLKTAMAGTEKEMKTVIDNTAKAYDATVSYYQETANTKRGEIFGPKGKWIGRFELRKMADGSHLLQYWTDGKLNVVGFDSVKDGLNYLGEQAGEIKITSQDKDKAKGTWNRSAPFPNREFAIVKEDGGFSITTSVVPSVGACYEIWHREQGSIATPNRVHPQLGELSLHWRPSLIPAPAPPPRPAQSRANSSREALHFAVE